MDNNSFPRLIADIGGTNARFAIETSSFNYEHIQVLACKDYISLSNAINSYLEATGFINLIKGAALALPSPEVGDTFFMVNSPWQSLSVKQTAIEIGLENLIFLNDFHALALAIPFIKSSNLKRIGGVCEPDSKKPIAILGPGTGLGMATLFKHPSGDYFAIPAEGGRSSFPPVNEEEIELWKFVHKRFSHVSAERFISGPGLQLIYEGLNSINKRVIEVLPTPSQIVEAGVSGKDWLCKQTVDIFCRMFGTVASNLAVSVNSFGGVYIGGGIIPKMIDYFTRSEFRSRFEDKGRYRPYLVQIPVYVIMQDFPAFLGASYALEVYITKKYIP
jgi:glucokinase